MSELGPFPTAEHKPALIAVYHGLVGELASQAASGSSCGERRYRSREWLAARLGMAQGAFSQLAAYAQDTWAAVQAAQPELGALEKAVRAQVKDRDIGDRPLLDALLWLAVDSAMNTVCSKEGMRPEAIARGLVQWATSPELQYHVAFGVLPMRLSGRDKGMGIWAGDANARASLRKLVLTPHISLSSQTRAIVGRQGADADRSDRRRSDIPATALPQAPDRNAASNIRVRVDGAAARVDCKPVVEVATDTGPIGDTNGIAERGEVVVARLSCRNTSDDDGLTSESLVLRRTSPCLVVPDTEVILPEVHPGAEFTVDLPTVLVSGLCGASPSITFDMISSEGRTGRVKLDIRLPDRGWSAGLALDQDRAGYSDPGKSDRGSTLAIGRRAELNVVARGDDGPNVREEVVDLRPLFAVDEKVLRATTATLGPAAMKRVGRVWQSVDDLDVAVASEAELNALAYLRRRGSALSRDGSTVWYRLTTATIAAPPAPATATQSSPTLAIYSAWHAVQPALGYAEFLSDLNEMVLAAGAMLTPDAIAQSVSPSYADVASAVSKLVEWKLLSGDALAKAFAQLDHLQGRAPGQPFDRDLGRRLVIAAAIAETYSADTRSDAFDLAEVLRMSPATALVRYTDAMLEARVQAIARKRLGRAGAGGVLSDTYRGVRSIVAASVATDKGALGLDVIPPDTILDVRVRFIPVALDYTPSPATVAARPAPVAKAPRPLPVFRPAPTRRRTPAPAPASYDDAFEIRLGPTFGASHWNGQFQLGLTYVSGSFELPLELGIGGDPSGDSSYYYSDAEIYDSTGHAGNATFALMPARRFALGDSPSVQPYFIFGGGLYLIPDAPLVYLALRAGIAIDVKLAERFALLGRFTVDVAPVSVGEYSGEAFGRIPVIGALTFGGAYRF